MNGLGLGEVLALLEHLAVGTVGSMVGLRHVYLRWVLIVDLFGEAAGAEGSDRSCLDVN